MSELIITKEGKPFKTEQAANLRMGVLKKNQILTEVVEVEDGFALKEIELEKPKQFIPMHESRRLRFPKKAGFHRHVINDDKKKNSIQAALNSGYTFVAEDIDGRDSRVGDTSRIGKNTSQMVGGGLVAYLMEKPQGLYGEHRGMIQKKLDRQMAGIKREKKTSDDGLYGGVKVEQGRM